MGETITIGDKTVVIDNPRKAAVIAILKSRGK